MLKNPFLIRGKFFSTNSATFAIIFIFGVLTQQKTVGRIGRYRFQTLPAVFERAMLCRFPPPDRKW
jgi:hypothetical protein